MALVSVGNSDDALDVVQEAMMQLASRYAKKPCDEWKPLFYRILHNKINDLHRRNKVRNRFRGWLKGYQDQNDNGENHEDPFQVAPDPTGISPESQHENRQQIEILESALRRLPGRQQQAFMLRCWEGLSTTETAHTMQCSEGSVKTHYPRALHTLRNILENSGDYRGNNHE